jgi:CheY-like chemotaxis protein
VVNRVIGPTAETQGAGFLSAAKMRQGPFFAVYFAIIFPRLSCKNPKRTMANSVSTDLGAAPAPLVLPCGLPFFTNVGDRDDFADARGRRTKDKCNARTTTGNRILLVGRLRELALYRAEVLSTHGFRVLTPETPAEAMEVIRRKQFDIAVLTYTLSSDVVEELAEQIRQYCPHCPLIAISDTERVDKKIFPDQTVLAREGPAGLIAALRRVTRKT